MFRGYGESWSGEMEVDILHFIVHLCEIHKNKEKIAFTHMHIHIHAYTHTTYPQLFNKRKLKTKQNKTRKKK